MKIKVMVLNYLGLFYWTNYMKIISSLAITISLMLAACSQANHEPVVEQQSDNTGTTQVAAKQKQLWQQVTVKRFDFEGGFFGLVGKEGQRLLPMNLSKKYQVNGTVLKVRGHIIEDMMTIQQWGSAYKITDVELIKLGKNSSGQSF